MSPASATAEKHVASYQITVDGAELRPELMNALGEIKIVDSLMLPDSLDLTMFINSYDKVKATQDVDDQPFKIGTEIVVKAGALEDRAPMTTVFEGQVVAVDADFGHGGITVGVRAYDVGHKLMRNRKARVFKKQTISDAVKAIIGENGLQADVTSTTITMDWLQQDNETDWDFIWRLARGIGYWLLIDGKKARFVPAKDVVKEETVELAWPDTIASFHPRVTGAQQVKTVTASAWDPKAKRAFASRAEASEELSKIGLQRKKVSNDLGGGAIHISNSSAVDQGEVKDLAKATLDRIATAYVEAEAHIPGNPKVKAGVTLKITGVGTQFSGEYLVGTVRHSLSGGGSFDTHVSTGTSTPSSLAAMTGRQRRQREVRRPARHRHREQQQGRREAGPGQGEVPGARRTARERLAADCHAERRPLPRRADAAAGGRRGARRLRERRHPPRLRDRLAVERQGEAGSPNTSRAPPRTTARSP